MKIGISSRVAMAVALPLLLGAFSAQAAMIQYDTWTTNENGTGNYIFTVDDSTENRFSYNLTISPWNAEALGIFIDLGDQQIGEVGFLSPTDQVEIYDTDSSSSVCGPGCNINGLDVPLAEPDGDWELILSLASTGFDGIQTFSWSTSDFGLTLADFGVVGIRAQQLCEPGSLLPEDEETGCGGSDKSYGFPSIAVPEPGTLGLLGLGLLMLGTTRRAKR